MKTNRILLCATALLIAACEKKSEIPVANKADSVAIIDGVLLVTEFPQEELIGTPEPIRFSGLAPMTVPLHQAQGPGTKGVFYKNM